MTFGVAVGAAAAGSACTNCSTALAGRYCHACGQDSVPDETALASWRSQWQRLVRTFLALVFHPGQLTREHLAGGRIRYIPPFTLVLNVIALFFLLSIVTQFRVQSFVQRDSTQHLANVVQKRAEAAGLSREVFLERVERRFQGMYTLCVATISLVGYTLLFKLVFRKDWSGWRGPFTFALHYLAFIFIALPAIMIAVHFASGAVPKLALQIVAMTTSAGVALAWLTLAIRRLFAGRWGLAVAKALLVLGVGFVIDQSMFLAALLLSLNLA